MKIYDFICEATETRNVWVNALIITMFLFVVTMICIVVYGACVHLNH